MVRLKNRTEKTLITPNQLKDGQLAEIIKWNGVSDYIGLIVQIYDKVLITVGGDSDEVWDNINDNDLNDGTCLVRVLEKGELIEVC